MHFTEVLSPPLTSVHQPAYDIGVAAAQVLFDRDDPRDRRVQFTPELLVRESTPVHPAVREMALEIQKTYRGAASRAGLTHPDRPKPHPPA